MCITTREETLFPKPPQDLMSTETEMNTLMIKDLPLAEQLDSSEMTAVRGGSMPSPSYSYFNYAPVSLDFSKYVMASQSNNTLLEIQAATGDNSAFLTNVNTTISPKVENNNNIIMK